MPSILTSPGVTGDPGRSAKWRPSSASRSAAWNCPAGTTRWTTPRSCSSWMTPRDRRDLHPAVRSGAVCRGSQGRSPLPRQGAQLTHDAQPRSRQPLRTRLRRPAVPSAAAPADAPRLARHALRTGSSRICSSSLRRGLPSGHERCRAARPAQLSRASTPSSRARCAPGRGLAIRTRQPLSPRWTAR